MRAMLGLGSADEFVTGSLVMYGVYTLGGLVVALLIFWLRRRDRSEAAAHAGRFAAARSSTSALPTTAPRELQPTPAELEQQLEFARGVVRDRSGRSTRRGSSRSRGSRR